MPVSDRPSKDALRQRGKRALERARANSGNDKVSSDKLWVEIQKMVQDGLTMGEMSFALNRSERYLRMVKADHEASVRVIPQVKMGRNLTEGEDGYEETRFTVAGFIKFFERFSGKRFPPHATDWIRAFVENRNVLLNVPPRHAKSTLFSIWVPTWLVCIDRNVQVLLISETKEFAKGWATEISGQLEMNDDLVSTYGQFAPDNRGDFPWRPNAGELVVRGRTRHARGAQLTIQSRGMEQQVLGMEADYVIADDPTNQEIAESETKRLTDMKHMKQQVLTRIEPQILLDDQGNRIEDQGGRAIVVGQRVHVKDMYGELAEQTYERGEKKGQPLWHVESYPAIKTWPEDSPTGQAEVLWPERWTYDELMVSYERIGGWAPFSCMYQQAPIPDEVSPFLSEWFEQCKDRSREGYVGIKRTDLNDTSRVCSVDPSPNNFNAIVVMDVIYDPKQFAGAIIEIDRFKGNLHDLVVKIISAYNRHHFDYLVFEESGFAKWFFEDPLFLTLKDKFKIIKHKTNINKNDREYGVQSLAGDLEFNRLSFPYADAEGRRMSELFGEEAINYGTADTDDVLMAVWFPKWNWRKLKPIKAVEQTHNSRPYSFLQQFERQRSPVSVRLQPSYSFINKGN